MNLVDKTMRNLWVAIGVIFFCGLSLAVYAGDDLYSAEAKVIDDSAKARNQSIKEAFHQVLIQVTGDRKVTARQGIPQLIKKATDYVQQFRFRVEPAAEGTDDVAKRFISVRFDKSAVDRALSSTSSSAWSGSRPTVLLWLAQDKKGKRSMLYPESRPDVVQAVNRAARQRGLPLQLPLMDLQDQAGLSASDLWTGYEASIASASARYPHDVVLTGKISARGKKHTIQWVLFDHDQSRKFKTSADKLSTALAAGVGKTADSLQQTYAPVVSSDTRTSVIISVIDVQSAGDFARVMGLLRQQDVIDEVAIRQSISDQLILALKLKGSVDTLERSLMIGNLLSPTTQVIHTGNDEMSIEPQLSYRLN